MSIRQLTLILFLSLCLVYPLVKAQDLAIQLTSLPPLVARPGEFVTAVFTLENQGTLVDTFDLDLFLPEDFILVVSLDAVAVSPGTEELIFATVLVPQDARAGEFNLQLMATSRADPSISVSSNAIIRVVETTKLDARAIQGQEDLEDLVMVTFVVINRGNVPDTISISVISQSDFQVEFSPRMAEINPGARLEIQVSIAIPPEIGADQEQDRVTLTAISTKSPEIIAQTTTTIVLVPPPPQLVDTSLAWEMPSQEIINISESQDQNGFVASSNFTGGGEFKEGHRLDVRFAIDNTPKIQTLAYDLDTPLFRIGWGDVSASFDRFTGIAGRGVRLTLRSPFVPSQSGLTFIGVPAEKSISLGLNSSINVLETDLSVSLVARFEKDQTDTIIGTLLQKDFMGMFSLSGQAALSRITGVWDSGLEIKSSFTQGPLGLNLELSRVGPEFIGSPKDQERLDLKQTLSLDTVVIQSLLSFGLNNVNKDPSKQTVGTSQVSIIARAFPGMNLPTISASANYQTQKGVAEPPDVSVQQFSGSLRFQQPFEFASATLVFGLTRTVDHVVGIDEGEITIDSLLGWSANGFSRSLGFSNVLGVDFDASLITKQVFKLTTAVGMKTPLGSLSLRLVNVKPKTEISATLASHAVSTNLNISGQWTFVESDLTGFRVQINVSKRFNVPIPFIPIKGQIEGFVFVDANNNERRDEGEGAAQLILIGGGARALTDDGGFFRFPPLSPGNYLINLERLPLGFIASVELPKAVALKVGERVQIEIPLKRISIIDGVIFNDRNQNGEIDAGEEGIPNVRVLLTSEGGITQQIRSTINGRFSFVDLLPGVYTLSLDENTFPSRFVLTTPGQLPISISAQETVSTRFGLVEKPPEIRITFSEPIAEFTFTPTEPKVGDIVQFDASGSSDPDGEITKFEWDFDGDGMIDAEGEQVEFTFSKAGEVSVVLTVTDTDGNIDQDAKIIQIKDF